MSKPEHGWFMTASGRKVWPWLLEVEDVGIEDVAHSLSCTPRFNGHTREHYSTAQHSILVSMLLGGDPVAELFGLIHDGGETYFGDVIRPVKHDPSMSGYRRGEKNAQRIVYDALGLKGFDEPDDLKRADNAVLWLERRQEWAPGGGLPWRDEHPLLPGEVIVPLPAHAAKLRFLERYFALREAVSAQLETVES